MVKIKIKTIETHLATPCLICGESVELTEYEAMGKNIFKICDKCKNAVMKMRGGEIMLKDYFDEEKQYLHEDKGE